ncbi:MAG: ARPP-1 family domain-containing protein [Hyphomicrobium sp.]
MIRQTMLPLLAASLTTLAWSLAPAGRAAAEPASDRLSGPFTHDNLTLYFVHGKSAEGPVPLTLEEALQKGAVTVHETGTVSQLAIENTGTEDILVHAGDIVKGGQQDRVLTTTMVLKPKSGKVPLDAFCVESGRWAARGSEDVQRFASAKEMMPSREAKLAMKVRTPSPGHAPNAGPVAAGVRREIIEQRRTDDVPSPNVTSNAGIEQRPGRPGRPVDAQGEVWKKVGDMQAALSASVGSKVNAAASESSLQLALENEKVITARNAYVDALQAAGEKDSDVVGYVFAVNGKINSADIYASNALFRKLWPRLLKAASTEALGEKSAADKAAAPAPAAVQTFLADAAKGKESEREPAKGLKLKVRDSDHAVDYETVGSTGSLVHRNVLAY